MSCAATRSADSGRRSLLTRLDGYRRQMCNDELFDEPEHRMRRTLASHIGPHAPLPRVPGAVERVVGVTTGVTKLCASHGVCVRSLARAGICGFASCSLRTCPHVCMYVICGIFYFRTLSVPCLQPYAFSIACIAFAAPRGVRSGLRSRMHPSSASIRPFKLFSVCRRTTSNLPRGASPVSRRSSPTEGAIHVTPLSRIHQNWLEEPRNRECSRPSYLQPRAPRQNGRVAVVCTVGTW